MANDFCLTLYIYVCLPVYNFSRVSFSWFNAAIQLGIWWWWCKYRPLTAYIEILLSSEVSLKQWKPLISHFVVTPVESLNVDMWISGLAQTTCNNWSDQSLTETRLSFSASVRANKILLGRCRKENKNYRLWHCRTSKYQTVTKLWSILYSNDILTILREYY